MWHLQLPKVAERHIEKRALFAKPAEKYWIYKTSLGEMVNGEPQRNEIKAKKDFKKRGDTAVTESS